MWQWLKNEPVALAAIIRGVILASAAFELGLTSEILVGIMVVVEALVALVTRAVVTPNGLAEYRVSRGGRPTVPLRRS